MRETGIACLLMGMAAGLTGCVSMNKAYPFNRVSGGVEIMPLQRNEYKVLGDTEGTACAKYLLGGKLPWFAGAPAKSVNKTLDQQTWFEGSSLVSVPLIGWLFGGKRAVVEEAIYEALENVPGADALLSVRVKTNRTFRIPGFYKGECATVKGKAFQIRTDKGMETAVE